MNLQQWEMKMQNLQQSLATKENATTKGVSQLMLTFFLNNFDAGGYEPTSFLIPWAERKFGLDHQALNKTGYLRASFRISQVSATMVELVNDAPYAPYIHEGTDKMPARPLFYESSDLNAQITALISKEFEELFNF